MKATHIFSAKNIALLTNDVVSFEQLGPEEYVENSTPSHSHCISEY